MIVALWKRHPFATMAGALACARVHFDSAVTMEALQIARDAVLEGNGARCFPILETWFTHEDIDRLIVVFQNHPEAMAWISYDDPSHHMPVAFTFRERGRVAPADTDWTWRG